MPTQMTGGSQGYSQAGLQSLHAEPRAVSLLQLSAGFSPEQGVLRGPSPPGPGGLAWRWPGQLQSGCEDEGVGQTPVHPRTAHSPGLPLPCCLHRVTWSGPGRGEAHTALALGSALVLQPQLCEDGPGDRAQGPCCVVRCMNRARGSVLLPPAFPWERCLRVQPHEAPKGTPRHARAWPWSSRPAFPESFRPGPCLTISWVKLLVKVLFLPCSAAFIVSQQELGLDSR